MGLPILKTPRLSLRPASADDADALHALWTTPDVRRFLFDDAEIGRDEARALLNGALRHATDGLGLWMIATRERPAPIGCAGLLPVGAAATFFPAARGKAETLIALDSSAWGRGYAGEALGAILRHAFSAEVLDEAVAFVDEPNGASHRLMLRLGFRADATAEGPRWPLRSYRLTPDALSAPLASERR